ncbi:hypothetical protein K439DRAFT_1616643 [Ramaria rubella]|nr:hypothetical protein K439DRAFT_1616643 [Ramaria rubella]
MPPRKKAADGGSAPSQQPPPMGPTLHETQAWPLYQDAIFRLINEKEDGTICNKADAPKRGTAATCKPHGRGGAARGHGAAHGGHAQPQPPTDASEAQLHLRWDKQREERLVRNEEEHESHNMGFPAFAQHAENSFDEMTNLASDVEIVETEGKDEGESEVEHDESFIFEDDTTFE